MPKPPPPPATNSKASIRSLGASRQAANPSIRAGNTSGGAKNFGSTSTNTRITLCLLFSLPLPAGIMPPDRGNRIPQVSQIARRDKKKGRDIERRMPRPTLYRASSRSRIPFCARSVARSLCPLAPARDLLGRARSLLGCAGRPLGHAETRAALRAARQSPTLPPEALAPPSRTTSGRGRPPVAPALARHPGTCRNPHPSWHPLKVRDGATPSVTPPRPIMTLSAEPLLLGTPSLGTWVSALGRSYRPASLTQRRQGNASTLSTSSPDSSSKAV